MIYSNNLAERDYLAVFYYVLVAVSQVYVTSSFIYLYQLVLHDVLACVHQVSAQQ